jgi:hypothetical protein
MNWSQVKLLAAGIMLIGWCKLALAELAVPDAPPPPITTVSQVVTGVESGGLVANLRANKTRFMVGDPMEFEVAVKLIKKDSQFLTIPYAGNSNGWIVWFGERYRCPGPVRQAPSPEGSTNAGPRLDYQPLSVFPDRTSLVYLVIRTVTSIYGMTETNQPLPAGTYRVKAVLTDKGRQEPWGQGYFTGKLETGPVEITVVDPFAPGPTNLPLVPPPAAVEIPILRRPEGRIRIVEKPMRLVVRNQTMLKYLGLEKAKVDFSKETVLVVCAGKKPTIGATIAIKKVVETEGRLQAEVLETSPEAGPGVGSYPADAVVIPRSDRPVFGFSDILPGVTEIGIPILTKDDVWKLTNQPVLARLALAGGMDVLYRSFAVEKLTDQSVLGKIASADPDKNMRWIAVRKLTDRELLAKITADDKDETVRAAAAERLQALQPPGNPQ